MNLKEPKRKKRYNSQPQISLPIRVGKKNEWIVYTAHLGISATCIPDPDEMMAVHSMGFFGKGSLSRSFPIFGNRKYGAPPLIKERQWKRRQQWLEEINKLESEALSSMNAEADIQQLEEESQKSKNSNKPVEIDLEDNSKVEDKNDAGNSGTAAEKSKEIDEVILDSAEEEDIYEVDDRTGSIKNQNDLQNNDIFILNDDQLHLPLQSYEYSENNDSYQSKDEINLNEMLVLPDSDSDTENYLTDIQPRIETEGFPVTETLQLTFEETFFLMYGLGCLQLVDYDGKLMSIINAWHHFNNQDKLFLPRYIVYHYFRSKGWVVKPGLQFGADFLLYKQGPPFYHASYVVIVETVDGDSLLKIDSRSSRNITWDTIVQMNRLSETAAKELMIAQVLWPSIVSTSSNSISLEALPEFTVREVLWRRWKPNQTDEIVSLEEGDSDDDSA